MNEISVKAPAKLNLHLQVIAKRNDGFHDLRTLFTFIDLYDQLTFKESEEKIELKELEPISDNLVLKAADLLKKRTNCNKGVKISLQKQIPLQKGLGGGSSDAGATLLALNKLWNLNLSEDKLMKIAATIGADVPFFVYGKNAFGEGIGEKLKEVEELEVKREACTRYND